MVAMHADCAGSGWSRMGWGREQDRLGGVAVGLETRRSRFARLIVFISSTVVEVSERPDVQGSTPPCSVQHGFLPLYIRQERRAGLAGGRRSQL